MLVRIRDSEPMVSEPLRQLGGVRCAARGAKLGASPSRIGAPTPGGTSSSSRSADRDIRFVSMIPIRASREASVHAALPSVLLMASCSRRAASTGAATTEAGTYPPPSPPAESVGGGAGVAVVEYPITARGGAIYVPSPTSMRMLGIYATRTGRIMSPCRSEVVFPAFMSWCMILSVEVTPVKMSACGPVWIS